MNITVNNINELPLISAQILDYIADYRVILFFAPMGAGKTTLINELCKQLGVTDQPSSPTFSIVNEYQSSNGLIFHFDFYRLKDEGEAFDLGYEEYFFSGNYCFVEWPEKIMNLLPSTVISIFISVLEDGTRKIALRKGLQ
ncbi:MAG TPA: tRNA (adenosine(37)-N6)-threonylcarbamoyltransferase complex ATPase subunit type 1 TsaE [Pseudosphingobacterium sp.]|nr:tRNA (adenosine(37)-N6)-threonylcarbamoyltransferase complex ATPase subunit type 1 TsaE [Pseudosphingobacterium sp.]